MSTNANQLLLENVRKEWIDYNGHMTDAAYAIVFSKAVDQFMIELGIDSNFRGEYQYSIYTLETHLCYLKEACQGQRLFITIQLLDFDSRRLHVFFVMENEDGERLATSEQMLMGIDMNKGLPAPFPQKILSKIEELSKEQLILPKPKEAGSKIGIRRK
ncbi:thioesterase [Cytobacillus depressus]|uniref:Thioesterase n=1 Tax=Cytobacillus depressus TaxID=1602942 RepID=A0A6L3V529_9BACI|nr:thioesterase family protein [Cytobacillus depressus]KAB2334562.1 thioesterase [Cytobacillus depressus]